MNHSFVKLMVSVTILVSCSFAQVQSQYQVAVNNLETQGASLDTSTTIIIADRIRNELINTGMFRVIERNQMSSILREQGFQQSGCTSDECAIEMGKVLGVKYIITGLLGKVGETYTLSIRMISVQTAEVVRTASSDCKCPIDEVLSTATVRIATILASGKANQDLFPATTQPFTSNVQSLHLRNPYRKQTGKIVIGTILSIASAGMLVGGIAWYINGTKESGSSLRYLGGIGLVFSVPILTIGIVKQHQYNEWEISNPK